MTRHKLRITAPEPTARTSKLWLDDLELLGLIEYQLSGDTSGPIKLELTLYVDSINADKELLKKLLEDE